MIAWLLANPLARKFLLYGAAMLAILYGLRLWGNAQWAKGETAGRQYMAIQMEKEKQAEWKAERDSIEAEKRILFVAQEQLDKDRTNIYRTLNDRLRAVKTANSALPGAVAAIPPDQLDAALRAISRELAVIR